MKTLTICGVTVTSAYGFSWHIGAYRIQINEDRVFKPGTWGGCIDGRHCGVDELESAEAVAKHLETELVRLIKADDEAAVNLEQARGWIRGQAVRDGLSKDLRK